METNKVKLLSNFQLFQFAQNELLDHETLSKVQEEFVHRNIATIEMKELERQYENTLDDFRKDLDANYWDPFYTAIAWRKHFRHIALLKTQGRKSDANRYQSRFYAGIFIYMLFFVCLLLVLRK